MNIVILGAGSIGCYLGAALHHAGLQPTLIGRSRMMKTIAQTNGLQITDLNGQSYCAPDIRYTDQPEALAEADLIILTVKCLSMPEAAQQLHEFAPPNTPIVCLQNGLDSHRALLNQNPELNLVQGIVAFNVAQQSNAGFHRGTDGAIHIQQHSALEPLCDAFNHQGIPCQLETDIESVIWGKLLLNLNNAINAIADIPLKTQIEQRPFRQVLGLSMRELLAVARQLQIQPARMTPLPSHWLPTLIQSPNWLFTRVARKMLAIDPKARSSMWEDLQHSRKTEVDYLNGAIAQRGAELGIATPVNQLLTDWVHAIERGERQAGVSGDELLRAVSSLS